MAVLHQMLIFLCLMLVGIYARRKGMLTEKNQQQISAITINIAYPAIILSGVGNGEKPMSGNELLVSFGAAIFVLVAMVIIGKILPRVLGYDKELFGIVNVMTVFTNIGFMGVPMIDGIYGKGALIYMTVFLIPFNILFYSYAIQTIQPDTSARKRFNLKDLCNIQRCGTNIFITFISRLLIFYLPT